jgi:integrase
MAKNIAGEGCIAQRKDGRWQASVMVDGKRRFVYGKTEREVKRKLSELKKQAAIAGGMPNPGTRTVNDLLVAWLENASDLKPTTLAHHRMICDTYVCDTLGKIRLSKLTPDRIQRLYTGLSPSVADKVHRVLHRAFEIGVLWRWLADNPCDRVLKPKYRAQRKAMWTPEQLLVFIEGGSDHWLYPLWVVAIATGLRSGELRALTWDDVDFDSNRLHVGATMHRLDGEYVRTEPKTTDSTRVVGLPQEAIAALRRQRVQQAEWRLKAGEAWAHLGLVFTGETGKPIHRSVPKNALQRECRRLGLPMMTMHDLRHLHASLLLEAGLPVPQVSKRLGHATPAITMSIYAHVMRQDDDAATIAISQALRGDIAS